MSQNKRSKLEQNKVNATIVFKLMVTLRKLNLAPNPSGIYHDVGDVFNVWKFVREHGEKVSDKTNKE